MYDEHLRDVFTKYYITNNYIFKDDTILNIKNKLKHASFGSFPFGWLYHIIDL